MSVPNFKYNTNHENRPLKIFYLINPIDMVLSQISVNCFIDPILPQNLEKNILKKDIRNKICWKHSKLV